MVGGCWLWSLICAGNSTVSICPWHEGCTIEQMGHLDALAAWFRDAGGEWKGQGIGYGRARQSIECVSDLQGG